MPYHIILGYSFIYYYISYKFLEIKIKGVGVEEGERKEEREGEEAYIALIIKI